jgi:hypothetical protein
MVDRGGCWPFRTAEAGGVGASGSCAFVCGGHGTSGRGSGLPKNSMADAGAFPEVSRGVVQPGKSTQGLGGGFGLNAQNVTAGRRSSWIGSFLVQPWAGGGPDAGFLLWSGAESTANLVATH